MTCRKTGTWDYNCWIPGSGYPTHHFLGTVTTVDISKKCYIQTSNAIQEWTEKYWECLVMVLIKSTGTNLEYIQILYMVSVYISINILTSNITYGNILKSYYICKEIYITAKKIFCSWKWQSSGTTAILCPANLCLFCTGSAEVVCRGNLRGIQIRQRLLYSKATPPPLPLVPICLSALLNSTHHC